MLKGDDNQVKFQYPSCESMSERPKETSTLKPMPLKAMMAKPIIQYPVYAVASDDDTERSNLTSTLNAYALKSDDGKTNYPTSCLCCKKR